MSTEPPKPSKLLIILTRKFQARWSDLDTILLMLIATEPRTFSQLVTHTNASSSGVWNSIQRLLYIDELAEKELTEGRIFYKLTPKGKQQLIQFLN